jgi:FkbM family methyltransferase
MHATSESRLGLSRKALAVHVGVFVFGMVFATWWQPRASSSSCVMVRPPVADTEKALQSFRDWYENPQHWRAGEPVIVAKSATSRPFYTFVYSPSVDQWTSGEILKSGTWHKTLIDTMEAFLQSRLRYGKAVNVLDIGANLGFFTLAAASLGSKVHVYAIEASPHHARMLRASLVFNDFSDRVTLFNSAVASKPSDKPLQLCEIDKGNRAGTMITESADTDALCAQVPVSTVDKLLGETKGVDGRGDGGDGGVSE